MQTYWFFTLIASICLEGLGRKYLPSIPSVAFYLLKDLVLLFGFVMFKPPESLRRIYKALYRGFGVFWIAAFMWTLVEVANPEQQSFALAVLGLRAYWLWWIAPLVIATVLQSAYHRRRAIYVLSAVAIGISVLAALQFVSPPDSAINVYSVVDGEALHASDAGIVYSTGRARVSGTFAFISGFSDFTVLVPVLLLSLGIETSDRRLRRVAFVATGCVAAVLPMAGSRSSVVLGIGVLGLTAWAAGLLFTRVGRRIIIGGVFAMVLAAFAFPDALSGVQSRFDDAEETQSRLLLAATLFPPVAIATLDYPMGGFGTGMMQNAAVGMHITTPYAAETEQHRYLVELGVIGLCLLTFVKIGLMVAFLRAYDLLKRAGRRGAAGAALSYAAVTFFGNLTFDHIWQALFFIGAGFILAETKAAVEAMKIQENAAKAATLEPPPRAVALAG
jgi:hypothetical protein